MAYNSKYTGQEVEELLDKIEGKQDKLTEESVPLSEDLETVIGFSGGELKRGKMAYAEELEDILAYGICRSIYDSDPACTRVGNMTLHKTLPVQSLMRGCLLDDDGNVVEYLPDDSWEGATLDGTKGQVMIRIPHHYRKGTISDDGTMEVRISQYPIAGYDEIPEMYISAYEATVQRSTLKLCSVKNEDADYRGGNNNADWDGEERSLLGKPATSISSVNFLTYARNRGTAGKNGYGWCSCLYEAQKALYWLFVIEYATLNSQATYNAELTSEGYHQGGLGNGVTTVSGTSWGNWNSYYPFIPCGYTDSLGNGTGIVEFDMPDGYGATLTVQVNRYRGVELPFGHIYKWLCDILVMAHPNEENGGDNLNAFYTCKDPSKFSGTSVNDYSFIGNGEGANSGWVYPTQMIFGAGHDFIGSDKGGSTSTYLCDGNYANNAVTADTLRGVLFGGYAFLGASAGLVCVTSNNAPSHTDAACGSRLCFLPE